MRYLNALRNQWVVSRAWMFTTFVFALFSAYLLIVLGRTVADMPTRLIPYEFATVNGPVKVTSGGKASGEYLALISASDLKSYTDWTPRTVQRMYATFANRLTPSLYAKIGADLVARSETLAGSERSQSFFVSHAEATKDTVRISGTLRVWQGSELIESKSLVYTLGYRFSGGVPMLNTFKSEGGR